MIVSWRGPELYRKVKYHYFENPLSLELMPQRKYAGRVEIASCSESVASINSIPQESKSFSSTIKSSIQIHMLVADVFSQLILDILYIIPSVLCLWRMTVLLHALCTDLEMWKAENYRALVRQQILHVIMDVPIFPLLLFVLVSGVRTLPLCHRLKKISRNSQRKLGSNVGALSWERNWLLLPFHRAVASEFANFLVDLPFVALALIISITLWRLPVLVCVNSQLKYHYASRKKSEEINLDVNGPQESTTQPNPVYLETQGTINSSQREDVPVMISCPIQYTHSQAWRVVILRQFVAWILDIPIVLVGIFTLVIAPWRGIIMCHDIKNLYSMDLFLDGRDNEVRKRVCFHSICVITDYLLLVTVLGLCVAFWRLYLFIQSIYKSAKEILWLEADPKSELLIQTRTHHDQEQGIGQNEQKSVSESSSNKNYDYNLVESTLDHKLRTTYSKGPNICTSFLIVGYWQTLGLAIKHFLFFPVDILLFLLSLLLLLVPWRAWAFICHMKQYGGRSSLLECGKVVGCFQTLFLVMLHILLSALDIILFSLLVGLSIFGCWRIPQIKHAYKRSRADPRSRRYHINQENQPNEAIVSVFNVEGATAYPTSTLSSSCSAFHSTYTEVWITTLKNLLYLIFDYIGLVLACCLLWRTVTFVSVILAQRRCLISVSRENPDEQGNPLRIESITVGVLSRQFHQNQVAKITLSWRMIVLRCFCLLIADIFYLFLFVLVHLLILRVFGFWKRFSQIVRGSYHLKRYIVSSRMQDSAEPNEANINHGRNLLWPPSNTSFSTACLHLELDTRFEDPKGNNIVSRTLLYRGVDGIEPLDGVVMMPTIMGVLVVEEVLYSLQLVPHLLLIPVKCLAILLLPFVWMMVLRISEKSEEASTSSVNSNLFSDEGQRQFIPLQKRRQKRWYITAFGHSLFYCIKFGVSRWFIETENDDSTENVRQRYIPNFWRLHEPFFLFPFFFAMWLFNEIASLAVLVWITCALILSAGIPLWRYCCPKNAVLEPTETNDVETSNDTIVSCWSSSLVHATNLLVFVIGFLVLYPGLLFVQMILFLGPIWLPIIFIQNNVVLPEIFVTWVDFFKEFPALEYTLGSLWILIILSAISLQFAIFKKILPQFLLFRLGKLGIGIIARTFKALWNNYRALLAVVTKKCYNLHQGNLCFIFFAEVIFTVCVIGWVGWPCVIPFIVQDMLAFIGCGPVTIVLIIVAREIVEENWK